MKNEYLECSCSNFQCLVRLSYFPDDKDVIYLETSPIPRNFIHRVWHALKYIFGFSICNSEAVLGRSSVQKMQNFCDSFLGNELVSEKAKPIYEWMINYDKEFAGKPNEIIKKLIEVGAEELYRRG
jgi:hypothetical protein